MENTNSAVTAQTPAQIAKATPNKGADATVYTINIHCAVRRRASLIGLPGTDPNERVYKIGASIDSVTRKNLRGISGILEEKYMPTIIGSNKNDIAFQDKINEYWGNIGVFIPADDPTLKDEDKGKTLKISIRVRGTYLKDNIENVQDIKEKVNVINEALEQEQARLTEESIPDYIFLCYCLKYGRVAKDITLVNNSPKIHFYIYNKNIATKVQLSLIELRNKAITYFTDIKDDETKVNQLLVMFNDMPTNYDLLDDKIIALDEHYNKNRESMQKFVDFVNDKNLELKYLISYATRKGKLHNPANSTAYYYNDTLLGKTIDDAVLFLKDESSSEAQAIKLTLEKEISN